MSIIFEADETEMQSFIYKIVHRAPWVTDRIQPQHERSGGQGEGSGDRMSWLLLFLAGGASQHSAAAAASAAGRKSL